jgi:hypothetical protein
MKISLIFIGALCACAFSMKIGFDLGWKTTYDATHRMLAMSEQHEVALTNAYHEKEIECALSKKQLAKAAWQER